MKKTVLFILALSLGDVATAETIRISPDGPTDIKMAILQARSSAEPFEIELAPGIYHLTSPITLTVEDARADKSPLVIKGSDGTQISGGIELPPFKEYERGVWVTDLSDVLPAGGVVEQLFVNGTRAVMARTPDENEFIDLAKMVDECIVDEGDGRISTAVQGIRYPESIASKLEEVKISNTSRVTIGILHKWVATKRYVTSINPKLGKIYIQGDRQSKMISFGTATSHAYLENDRAFLDAEGEFFYDVEASLLYYVPRDGDTLESSKAVIPGPKQLLVIKGTEYKRVTNIHFENICFAHTRYTMPRRGEDAGQGAALTDAAVMVDYADNIGFTGCEIAHTGNNGIWMRTACRDCFIDHCYIHDIGIGAVKLGDSVKPSDEESLLTRNIRLDNSILRSGCHVIEQGEGVLIFNAAQCQITHNEIADFYYTGISVGWTWGYDHSPAKGNKILYNHIHHIGWGFLSDMGGVYTLGLSEDTEVSHNVIHHISSCGYGGWGLYTDEGSTGIRMEYNLVYDCKSAGFHQHYGADNVIRNNVFINSSVDQLEATRVEDHNGFNFTKNIICYENGNMYGINWDKANAVVDTNLYWRSGGGVSFGECSLEEWTEVTGKDSHSIVADPELGGYREGDISFGNKSVLKRINFEPFSIYEVGVYGSRQWKELARFDSQRAALYDKISEAYKCR